MSTRWRAFLSERDGSVILETALMITVLLLLAFGMIDFGRVMYTSNSLVSAAREGARAGAVMNSISDTAVQRVVRSRFNSYTFGGDTLKNSNIAVHWDTTNASASPYVADTITYSFKWITPAPCLLKWANCKTNTTTLHASGTFRYEENR